MSCRRVKKRGDFVKMLAAERLEKTTRPPKGRPKKTRSRGPLRKWFDAIPVSQGKIHTRRERRQRWFDALRDARQKAPVGTKSRYHLAVQPFAGTERTYLEVHEREPYGSSDPTYKGRRNTYKVKRAFMFVQNGNRAGSREKQGKQRLVMRKLVSIAKAARAMNLVPTEKRGRVWKQELRFLAYQTRELRPKTPPTEPTEGSADPRK